MRSRWIVVLLVLSLAGCRQRSATSGLRDPADVEWRVTGSKELSGEDKEAVDAAKGHLRDRIRGLLVACADDDGADLHHVEYDVVAEGDARRITGRFILRYQSTGRLGGFPEGGFVLNVGPDGTVTDLHLRWE